MKVLELFSGTECISNTFRSRGHEAFTIDWNREFPSSMHCDIGTLKADDILNSFGRPDVIWAAFDCTTFSIAAISHHRKKNEQTGNLDPVSDYARKCDSVDQNVIALIKELNPKVFIIENPRGGAAENVLDAGILETDHHILPIWGHKDETDRLLQQYQPGTQTPLSQWRLLPCGCTKRQQDRNTGIEGGKRKVNVSSSVV